MSKAQLVITAVVLEGRSKSEGPRDYDVSRYWVQQLVKRYETEGRRRLQHARADPTTIPARSAPSSKTRSCDYARPWTKRVTTPGRPPSPNTWPATPPSPKCPPHPRSGES
jgi:hypothetical protein